jgi:hypothetical protein
VAPPWGPLCNATWGLVWVGGVREVQHGGVLLVNFLALSHRALKLKWASHCLVWVSLRRDPRRGTEPQMSLKQFLSNTQSGTERFYAVSASLVHRLSNLSAGLLRGSPFRKFHGFHEFEASETNYRAPSFKASHVLPRTLWL